MIIFHLKNIIYIFIYFSHKLLIKCDSTYDCTSFPDCYNCMLCSDERKTDCDCAWTNSGCTSYGSRSYLEDEGWYSKILICQNLDKMNGVENVYCPSSSSKKTETDLQKDKSINYLIYPDSNGFYGKDMVVCSFEYKQDSKNNIKIEVDFSEGNSINPKVYIESTGVTNIKTKENVDKDKEVVFEQCSKIVIKVLLKQQYTKSPIKIKLGIKNSNTKLIIIIVVSSFFGLIFIICIICCICRIKRKNEDERLYQIELYRQARENMARIELENNNSFINENEESKNLEKFNKQKLDYLFKNEMANHLYKKEYNQFGGGCSICLKKFKKKCEVSITSCKHIFHYQCIHDWLYKNIRNPKCPNCNHEILSDNLGNNINNEKETQIIKVMKKTGGNNFNYNNNLNRNLNPNRVTFGGNENNEDNNYEASSRRQQIEEF